MADVNAPSDQILTMAPPVRTNDQILPHIRWIPIGKSNCYLDLEKSQSNPIYKIAVDLLKNTNFFRAFSTSSNLPSIYIQQSWDTILYDKKDGCYKYQLDEQWFGLTKETLREALQITPVNRNQAFAAPPSIYGLIDFVNQLGYPKLVMNLSTVVTNDLFQPWRALLTIINLYLMGKISGFKRPRAPVLQILWGIVTRANIDYRKHRFHPRPDSPLHLSNEEPILGYLKFSAKGSTQDLPAPKLAKPTRKPQSTVQKAPLKPSISSPVTSTQPAPTSPRSSPKSVGASEAEEVPAEELQVADEDADFQKAVEESMKDAYALPKGPLPPVVIREPESGKYQPLPEVPGKGKAKVSEERVFEPTTSSFNDESPYEAGPDPNAQAEDQKRSDTGAQAEGQDGLKPDETSEGQAGPDPGNAEARVQSTSSPVVHAGSDREHMDLDVANVSPQPSTKQLYEGFTAMVYPNVQENLKIAVEEPVSLEEPASSSGTLSSLQHLSRDFSFGDQFFSDKHSDADKSAETEVESMVSIAVSGVVTDAVDWVMQAPLRNRFRDLPEADMNEILHQRMWESNSYKSHEDHMQLFEALEKSINHDHSEELAHDLAEAQKKRKKGRELPKTPPGSPSHQPPPPPPPAGPSRTSRAPRASGSQVTPPPPPPTSTDKDSPSKGSAAPSPSKTAATTKHQAWTTPDVTLKPLVSLTPEDLDMDEATGPDDQAQLSDEEDIRSAQIPTVNLRQGWWKLFEEERHTTPEPAWSIRSSNVPVLTNNWASTLASNYSPPPEDSLLAQTDDITTFMDWHNVSKPQPLRGQPSQVTIQSDFFFNKDLEYLRYGSKGRRPALSISKIKAAYYPDAVLEQMVPDYTVRTYMRILSVVRIKVFSMYRYPDGCSCWPKGRQFTTPCPLFKLIIDDSKKTYNIAYVTLMYAVMIKDREHAGPNVTTSQDASRPNITFAVCACARFQVTPKTSHLHNVKRIFRYLKGQPKLGLWYPKGSPFDLEAYSDSDYAGASLHMKSTTRGCQFLGKRSISWQCKKQTIVANSTTEAEYVAAATCYGQVLWIQNQMLDYGYNLNNTKIYIDNESTICIVKNLAFHYKTKHIEIRNHFIRYLYEKKLIQATKISQSSRPTNLVVDEIIYKGWEDRMERADTTASSLEAEHDSVFLDKQDEGMAKHKEIYVMSSHAKKIFANIKREGQDFFRNVTPLFDTMMVIAQEEKKMKPKRKQRQAAEVYSPSSEIPVEESIPTPFDDALSSGEDSIQLNELMIFYTSLQQQVLDLEEAKIAQAKEISKLKKRVKKLEKRIKSRPARLRRIKKVGTSKQVESSEEQDSFGAQEDASKQGWNIKDIDLDADNTLVDESQGRMEDAYMFGVDDLEGNEVFVEKSVEKEVNTADPVTTVGEVVIAASVEDSAAPTTATTTNVDDELTLAKTLIAIKAAKPKVILTAITTPRAKGIVFHEQVQAHKPTVSSSKDKGKAKMIEPEIPLKKKDQIALDEQVARKLKAKMRAELEEEERIARDKDEANRAMIEEWDDVQAIIDANRQLGESILLPKELKRLGTNHPQRADENSQNYLTFRTMFKNFNREDLEVLRSIVKERFKKTKPVDDMENLLFQTLKTMFEPHVEDIIWKYQQRAVKVNNWKLFDSCGVYCVTTKTMVYYLMVEKMYLFTNSILHQLWSDVRLQVDYEVVNATYVQLVLLVYKVVIVFNKVNAAKSRVTTVVSVSTGR
nr:putative reverse transcriptase, RNA-dependent DNA polymerase [Tanacetum cinerariifolium]